MAIEVIEHAKSRSGKAGRSATSQRIYKAGGSEERVDIRTAILALAPITDEDGLLLLTLDLQNKGGGRWEGIAEYGLGERSGGDPGQGGSGGQNDNHTPAPTDSVGSEFTFDTTGGTKHVTQSIATLAKAKSTTDAVAIPDLKGVIGLDGKNVKGTDVPDPKLRWSETWKYSVSTITWAYVQQLAYLTGKTNRNQYRNLKPGEVMFFGATGAPDGTDKFRITYSFEGSPNQTGIQVEPTFDPVDKAGWDHLWVAYKDKDVGGFTLRVPKWVFVEQVSEYEDLRKIGIGG